MIRVDRADGQTFLLLGPRVISLDAVTEAAMAGFLDEGAAERVWQTPDGVAFGDIRLAPADEADELQRDRDLKRKRVILSCAAGRWHIASRELERLGRLLRGNSE